MKRAQEQDISVTHVDMTDDSFIFHVQGVSGEYMIEIYEDVTLWPPTCDCQDYYWRGDILCKHIILCLVLMGVDAGLLEDSDWVKHGDWNFKMGKMWLFSWLAKILMEIGV